MTVAQIQLKAAAAQVHQSQARVRVLFSGRRFGKTRLMLTEALATALEKPGSQIGPYKLLQQLTLESHSGGHE